MNKIILPLLCAIIFASCSQQKFAFRKKIRVDAEEEQMAQRPKRNIRQDVPQNEILSGDLLISVPEDTKTAEASEVTTPIFVSPTIEHKNAEHEAQNVYSQQTTLAKSKVHLAPHKTMSDRKIWAIIGFVLSLVGLLVAAVPFGILAIIFGAIALSSSKKGLAIAAIIIGIVDVVIGIILISNM